MNPRIRDRLAAGVSLLLLLALAGGSYYLAELSWQMATRPVQSQARHEPDYYVEGLVFTRINAHGDPAFRMSAQRMVHYPDDDSTAFDEPVLVSLDPAQPPIRLVADRGTSTTGGVETHLSGHVVMTRAATEEEPPMIILTDYVVLFSQTEIARTDRPVRIERGASVLTGVGMEFNNAARTLIVDSEVQGTWQPVPKTR
ncbi:MAG: LPS export ABC transporter periplasmic protein LptC [Gammaproteobacteria bacterium]